MTQVTLEVTLRQSRYLIAQLPKSGRVSSLEEAFPSATQHRPQIPICTPTNRSGGQGANILRTVRDASAPKIHFHAVQYSLYDELSQQAHQQQAHQQALSELVCKEGARNKGRR